MNTKDVNCWQGNATKETIKLINSYLSRLVWINRLWFTYKNGNIVEVDTPTGEVWYIRNDLYEDYKTKHSRGALFLPENVTLKPIKEFCIKTLRLNKGNYPYKQLKKEEKV